MCLPQLAPLDERGLITSNILTSSAELPSLVLILATHDTPPPPFHRIDATDECRRYTWLTSMGKRRWLTDSFTTVELATWTRD